jgi:phosphatidylglycerol---prolipoprotein diacylglyceryl transferase
VYPVLFHIGPLLVPSYGLLAALGVLASLTLLLRTSKVAGLNPNLLWNLSIVALFAAIVGPRLVLVALNWRAVRNHPAWLLGVAMVHHPLLAAIGSLFAFAAAAAYARWQRLPLRITADAFASPLCLGLAFEELGALLAGSGFGTQTDVHWAVIYTSPFAARWSGAPLYVPLHPVQAYAAISFLAIAIVLLVWAPHRRQAGDMAGIGLMAAGTAFFFTEFWRDPEGRGAILEGAINAVQAAGVGFVLVGAAILSERKKPCVDREKLTTAPKISAEVSRE